MFYHISEKAWIRANTFLGVFSLQIPNILKIISATPLWPNTQLILYALCHVSPHLIFQLEITQAAKNSRWGQCCDIPLQITQQDGNVIIRKRNLTGKDSESNGQKDAKGGGDKCTIAGKKHSKEEVHHLPDRVKSLRQNQSVSVNPGA